MNKNEIKNINKMYEILSKIAISFSNMTKANKDKKIKKALSMLGKYANVDRAFIYQYFFDKKICRNMHEWCAKSVKPIIDKNQNININKIIDFVKAHKNAKPLYIKNIELLEDTNKIKDLLSSQKVKTVITIPLFHNNVLQGFIGFNTINEVRPYSELEITILNKFGDLFITAIKRLELLDKLAKEKLRLEFTLNSSTIGTWEWDLITDKLVINDIGLKLIGYNKDKLEPLTHNSFYSLMHNDDINKSKEAIKKLLLSKKDTYENEYRIKHKDGHYIWLRDSGKITKWENGVGTYLIGTYIDITKIKKREAQLQVHLHAIDSTSSGVLISDKNGFITFANNKYLKLMDMESEDIIGKKAKDIKYELSDDYEKTDINEILYKEISNGKEWSGTLLNYNKENEKTYIDAKFSPVYNERGNMINYVGIFNDVTKETANKRKIAVYQKALEERIIVQNTNLEDSQKATVFALAKLVEARDEETGSHVHRVQNLCEALALKLQTKDEFKAVIDEQFISDIYHASALHDIGKIKTPDSILLKPGKLTKSEFKIMQEHVKTGAETLYEMNEKYPHNTMILMGAEIAKYHHEKWDGKGYLEGLSGEDIPISARIMGLVDAYDAIRSKRPYKKAISHKDAVAIIRADAGTHFDPKIVRAFTQINEEFEIIYDTFEKINK